MPGGPPVAPLGDKGYKLSCHVSPADLPVVRDLILPHSVRWRTFELLVDDFHLMYNTLATLSCVLEAPELRALRLCHHDDNKNHDHFSPVDLKQPFFTPFSGCAPELGLVTLRDVHVDWETCAFLQGLEELELAYHAKDVRPPYKIFTRILRGSPDLHTLTLSASGPAGDPEVDWPANVIELPSVRQLGLASLEPSYASALLKRIVFPNLLVLSLDFHNFDQEDYSSFITEQLTKPAPNQRHSLCHNLVDLKLSGMQCSPTAVSRLYYALSNLVSLDINFNNHLPYPFWTDLFWVNLVDEPHDTIPKLATLTTSGLSGAWVCHLLSQRPKIKHVRMDSEADMTEEDEAWLRAHTESFDFFDNEDDDIASVGSEEILIVDLTDEEGDEVPGEWVDDSSIE
ncbi:hypothetical protein EDB85DRAFT_2012471 [Lactarius pseudohatsudake]|nr:hypothetical protein EDB85DRAFT_2012471 [Lactarius pseudohatsudake]